MRNKLEFDLGRAQALLLIDASERNADLLYASGFRAPDPFVFLWQPAASLLLVSDLEVDRARTQSCVDRVIATSQVERELPAGVTPDPDQVLLALLRQLGLSRLIVPADFPVGKADRLRTEGLDVRVAPVPLFPGRQIKTDAEIEAVCHAMGVAERAMAAALEVIGAATVRDGLLMHQDEPLTSERVRYVIQNACLQEGYSARHTIVAGGEQGCDPHQEGHGPLAAGKTIIIDIFPQSDTTGYFGDMTRTVVKGDVPPAVQRLYDAVLGAQRQALDGICAGIDGRELHAQLLSRFAAGGYETGERDGYMQGFFHGTGHGLGLEIHEAPRIGKQGHVLQAGQIVTVEPGLYYRGLGGVRLEDTVVVRSDGCENLTTFPKVLQV